MQREVIFLYSLIIYHYIKNFFRWANYLDPSINRSEWTEEEDRIIIEGVKEHGKCWGKISTKLKGRHVERYRFFIIFSLIFLLRPNNAIKNRFNTVIRKKYKYIEKENVNTEIKNGIYSINIISVNNDLICISRN